MFRPEDVKSLIPLRVAFAFCQLGDPNAHAPGTAYPRPPPPPQPPPPFAPVATPRSPASPRSPPSLRLLLPACPPAFLLRPTSGRPRSGRLRGARPLVRLPARVATATGGVCEYSHLPASPRPHTCLTTRTC
ncbi:hypothetical protein MPTK1_3g12970 [Marchantia polymorpha subsp. ruderalis]|uniref:Uncharacterized protein n=2 Tax=Marchantia polymorpha TaxID=3197 RepID=A0AAF6B088_MARPO|nr:hypothetical protein MARPO_0050s0089 [Marchantia polymorpha]BBN05422.1 hypothetical protein Mp_3g12970 [Marchantia polymorpha subsp. ruderalis]|eukprot:PTQ38635.1 hypothetical protein MARPO_0050s0089 [Marchantia polymorpha]